MLDSDFDISSLPEPFRSLVELSRQMKCTREDHDALKQSSFWSDLDYVGIQEGCEEYDLELRNCKCGSTLAKRIRKIPLTISATAD